MDKPYLILGCCPFCGGEGKHQEVVVTIGGEPIHVEGFVIRCATCGGQTAPKETWAEAEVAWSDRPEAFPLSTTHAKVC